MDCFAEDNRDDDSSYEDIAYLFRHLGHGHPTFAYGCSDKPISFTLVSADYMTPSTLFSTGTMLALQNSLVFAEDKQHTLCPQPTPVIAESCAKPVAVQAVQVFKIC